MMSKPLWEELQTFFCDWITLDYVNEEITLNDKYKTEGAD